ncbi:hypothetical protein HG530_002084 [Fusarium avenaceum]|nr:hypothetical protein HG530_002084 [Fusarium avenaceum]
MVVNEILERSVDVLVKVLGQSIKTDTLSTDIELLINGEAAVIGDKDLADHDREGKAVSVGDPHESLLLGEALDVASSEFSDLTGLLSLLRQERSLSAANLLLNSTILLAIGNTTNNILSGALGDGALARARVPAVSAGG